MSKSRLFYVCLALIGLWLVGPGLSITKVQAADSDCHWELVNQNSLYLRLQLKNPQDYQSQIPQGFIAASIYKISSQGIYQTFYSTQIDQSQCIAGNTCYADISTTEIVEAFQSRFPNDSASNYDFAFGINNGVAGLCINTIALEIIIPAIIQVPDPPRNNGTGGLETDPDSPTHTLTEDTLDSLNPLKLYSANVDEDLSQPGGIITRVLRFAFPIAGLVLFVMLIWAGFEILSGAAGKKSIDAGKQRATAAVIGFILLFVSYWLTQIVSVIFGITIL